MTPVLLVSGGSSAEETTIHFNVHGWPHHYKLTWPSWPCLQYSIGWWNEWNTAISIFSNWWRRKYIIHIYTYIYIYTYSGMSDALEGEKLICFKQNGNGIRFVSKDVFILALISPNISRSTSPSKKNTHGILQHSQVHDRPIAKLQAHNARWIHHPTLPGCALELGSRTKKRQKCVRNWGFFLVKLLVF